MHAFDNDDEHPPHLNHPWTNLRGYKGGILYAPGEDKNRVSFIKQWLEERKDMKKDESENSFEK